MDFVGDIFRSLLTYFTNSLIKIFQEDFKNDRRTTISCMLILLLNLSIATLKLLLFHVNNLLDSLSNDIEHLNHKN